MIPTLLITYNNFIKTILKIYFDAESFVFRLSHFIINLCLNYIYFEFVLFQLTDFDFNNQMSGYNNIV